MVKKLFSQVGLCIVASSTHLDCKERLVVLTRQILSLYVVPNQNIRMFLKKNKKFILLCFIETFMFKNY